MVMPSKDESPVPLFDDLLRIQDRLNSMQYSLDQIGTELQRLNAETEQLLRIAWKIASTGNKNRVYETNNSPAHTVVLFLKNIISFEGMLKVLADEHSYTNFELIKVAEKLNEYLPKEKRV